MTETDGRADRHHMIAYIVLCRAWHG